MAGEEEELAWTRFRRWLGVDRLVVYPGFKSSTISYIKIMYVTEWRMTPYLELRLVVREVEAHLDLLWVLLVHVDIIQRAKLILGKGHSLLSRLVILT